MYQIDLVKLEQQRILFGSEVSALFWAEVKSFLEIFSIRELILYETKLLQSILNSLGAGYTWTEGGYY